MRSYFTGIIGYVFLVLFLAIGGVVFCTTTLFSMSASVSEFFMYMMLLSGVMLPLLTMKSFSEERKTKTEQLVLTAPVSLPAMVFGKFFAEVFFFHAIVTKGVPGGDALIKQSIGSRFFFFAEVKTRRQTGDSLGAAVDCEVRKTHFYTPGLRVVLLIFHRYTGKVQSMPLPVPPPSEPTADWNAV